MYTGKAASRQKELPVKGVYLFNEAAEIRCTEGRQPHQNAARAPEMQGGYVQIFKPAAEGDSPRAACALYPAERRFPEFVCDDVFKARSNNDEKFVNAAGHPPSDAFFQPVIDGAGSILKVWHKIFCAVEFN